MSSRIPLIVCGAKQQVATMVRANMLPEYEVVYSGFDLTATAQEVPRILANSGSPQIPASSLHTQVGTNDFSVAPLAIVAGGGYSDEAFQRLFQACADACGSEEALPVPFFRVDNAITRRLVAEGKGPETMSPEYPHAIANRLKAKLREVGVGLDGLERRDENRGKTFFF